MTDEDPDDEEVFDTDVPPPDDDDDREEPLAGVAADVERTLGGDPPEEAGDREPVETPSSDGPEVRSSTGRPDGEREGPLSDVAGDVDRRRDEREEFPEQELFDRRDVGEIDREQLWRQVAGEDVADEVEDTGTVTEVGSGEGPAERIVSKEKYCHGCEHFSPPPDVHCTHEGTRIAELVDMEHFRVFDCPVVAEDEELENY